MPTVLAQFVRTIASRIAAVIGAVLVAFAAGRLGVPVTEAHADSLIAWLTTGLTGLGYIVAMLVYPVLHKLLSRVWNPADNAKPGVGAEASKP